MKKLLALLIIICCTGLSLKTEALKILFIGNSLTSYNDLPDMFQKLTIEGGKDVVVDKAIFPGQALRHYAYSSKLKDAINSETWDYVILQSDDISAFPDMYDIEINTLKKIESVIVENSPNAKIVYEMIWGIKGGVNIQGEGYYSYQEYFEKINTGTLHFADTMNYITAPVGKAWNTTINAGDTIELFHQDRAHPALAGSYLAACVFYSTIFEEAIRDFSFNGGLQNDDAVYLQNTASETVLGSLNLLNLSTNNISLLKETVNPKVLVYPNPVAENLHFRFKQIQPSTISVKIYDIGGKLIHNIVSKKEGDGEQLIKWNCRKENGEKLKSGFYFYEFNSDFTSESGTFSVSK